MEGWWGRKCDPDPLDSVVDLVSRSVTHPYQGLKIFDKRRVKMFFSSRVFF